MVNAWILIYQRLCMNFNAFIRGVAEMSVCRCLDCRASSIFHHLLAIVIALNFFRLRSRFQHQQTLYILIYCAVYDFQLQTVHFFLVFRALTFSLLSFSFFLSSDSFVDVAAADFIYLLNSISEFFYRSNQFQWKITETSIKLRIWKFAKSQFNEVLMLASLDYYCLLVQHCCSFLNYAHQQTLVSTVWKI